MIAERFFHLDCNAVIPECGHKCAKCIDEIRSVVGGTSGVAEVSLGKRGAIAGIAVRYDPDGTSDEDLVRVLRTLPTFYRGRFVPKVLDA